MKYFVVVFLVTFFLLSSFGQPEAVFFYFRILEWWKIGIEVWGLHPQSVRALPSRTEAIERAEKFLSERKGRPLAFGQHFESKP